MQAFGPALECAAYAVSLELTEEEVMIAVAPGTARRSIPGSCSTLRGFDPALRRAALRRIVDALPKTPSQRIQKIQLRSEGTTADTVEREQLGLLVPRPSLTP